jgi:hypothetical protein
MNPGENFGYGRRIYQLGFPFYPAGKPVYQDNGNLDKTAG